MSKLKIGNNSEDRVVIWNTQRISHFVSHKLMDGLSLLPIKPRPFQTNKEFSLIVQRWEPNFFGLNYWQETGGKGYKENAAVSCNIFCKYRVGKKKHKKIWNKISHKNVTQFFPLAKLLGNIEKNYSTEKLHPYCH